MLLSLRKNGLDALFKEVRGFKVSVGVTFSGQGAIGHERVVKANLIDLAALRLKEQGRQLCMVLRNRKHDAKRSNSLVHRGPCLLHPASVAAVANSWTTHGLHRRPITLRPVIRIFRIFAVRIRFSLHSCRSSSVIFLIFFAGKFGGNFVGLNHFFAH